MPVPVSAASRFGVYKPSSEGVQPVRQLQVEGDELQQLRNLRAMIKETPSEAVMNAMETHHLNVFEALALAKETGKLLVPNDVLDNVLNQTAYNLPTGIARGLWTGTMVIFEEPNEHFGGDVLYSSEPYWLKRPADAIEFSIPEKFRGRWKCALVVEHPDFKLVPHENGGHRLIVPDESKLHLIEGFPQESGWHTPDPEFGIPCDEVKTSRSDYRYLRRNRKNYIGLLVRGYVGVVGGCDTSTRGVNAECPLSNRFGVALI